MCYIDCPQCKQVKENQKDIKDFFEVVVMHLYGTFKSSEDEFKYMELERCIEEIAYKLDVDFPMTDIKYKKVD